MKIKRLAVAAAPVGAVVLGSTFIAAPPAHAGEVVCKGDICVQTRCYDHANDSFYIDAWANNKTFYGHFQMYDDGGYWGANSPTRSWPAGGTHYTFHAAYSPGFEIGIAWEYNKTTHKYTNIGQKSFDVGIGNEPACS